MRALAFVLVTLLAGSVWAGAPKQFAGKPPQKPGIGKSNPKPAHPKIKLPSFRKPVPMPKINFPGVRGSVYGRPLKF